MIMAGAKLAPVHAPVVCITPAYGYASRRGCAHPRIAAGYKPTPTWLARSQSTDDQRSAKSLSSTPTPVAPPRKTGTTYPVPVIFEPDLLANSDGSMTPPSSPSILAIAR